MLLQVQTWEKIQMFTDKNVILTKTLSNERKTIDTASPNDNIIEVLYIMNRLDGLSFRSNPDLLQRHKTSTNKYISIYRKREGKGIKERIQKEAGK